MGHIIFYNPLHPLWKMLVDARIDQFFAGIRLINEQNYDLASMMPKIPELPP